MGHSYAARVLWESRDGTVRTGRYSRAHRWLFDEGVEVTAAASPLHVPLPWTRADAVDPEEGFVAALSSCHMLFALSFAAKDGWIVTRYEDHASGEMGRDERGLECLARVTLRPVLTIRGDRQPCVEAVADMHHRAHAACYLANSVRCEILVEPGDTVVVV